MVKERGEIFKKEAQENIKKWKNRLGFSGWKFKIKVITFKRSNGFLQDGDIEVNYYKKQATILIGKVLKAPIEEIIIHELIHLILWPLDQKIVSIVKSMPKSKQKKALDDFLDQLEEMVAHITRLLTKASYKKYRN